MKQYGMPNTIIANTILKTYFFNTFSSVMFFLGLRNNTPVIITNMGTHHCHKFLSTIQTNDYDFDNEFKKYKLIGEKTCIIITAKVAITLNVLRYFVFSIHNVITNPPVMYFSSRFVVIIIQHINKA
jgi:hypothetical protein